MESVERFFSLLTFVSLATYRVFSARQDGEMVFNVSMAGTDSNSGVRSVDLSVGALQQHLQFRMRGCGGLLLSLLRPIPPPADDAASAAAPPHPPFIQIYLGYDTSIYGIIIRECASGGASCEDRAVLKKKVLYCYEFVRFWLRWNDTTIDIGGGFNGPYQETLLSYSPPSPPSPSSSPSPPSPSSSLSLPSPSSTPTPIEAEETESVGMLSGISRIRVENENQALTFAIYRGPDLNRCFVGEAEQSLVAQCGDDFIDSQRCIDCGCCHDNGRHPHPPCYRSLASTVVGDSSYNCSRSLEDLFPDMLLFLPPQPLYVNASIDHLIVIGSFLSSQFQFLIDFGDDAQQVELMNVTQVEPLPQWLPDSEEFQRLQAERNLSVEEVEVMHRCSVIHVYEENDTFVVSLIVSGRLNRNESSWSSWNKSVTVTIHARPTLEEALNGTYVVSSFPVYRLAPASFWYLVRNADPSLNYSLFISDGSHNRTVILEASNMDQVPAWIANGSYASNDGDGRFIPGILEELGEFQGGQFQYVFHNSGLQFVSLTVAGNLTSVGVHSTVTRAATVTVRPLMKDMVEPMLFISQTPAYVSVPVFFLFLIRNHYDSLLYKINYGDASAAAAPGRLEINFNCTQLPDWVRRKYYKLHGVDEKHAERILSQSHSYNCSLVSYVYSRVRRHTTNVTVAGTLEAVGRYEYISLVSVVDVIEQRKTIWELLAGFVLLTSKVNYVNASSYFLYRFGDFSDDLELSVNYGDGSERENLSVTGSATLPHWAHSGQYVTPTEDENGTLVDEVFADPGDSFLGGVASHEYSEEGTYNVTFHVKGRGPLNEEIQRRTTATVRRRPTLAEVVGEVVVFVKIPVYEETETSFLALVENHFADLSYDLHFGDDSAPEELLIVKIHSLPIWVTSPKSSFYSTSDNISSIDALLLRLPTISGAIFSHAYSSPGQRNVSLTVSGWLDVVSRIDEHRSSVVVVTVKSRSRLSDSLGACVLMVSDPATVNENVRFLFIGTKFVSDIDYQLDFGDGSPALGMTPISTNLNALEWMSDQRFVTFGPVDVRLPRVMADLSRFNGTAATQTHIYSTESTFPILLRLSAKYSVPLEMGRFLLKVTRRSTGDSSNRETNEVVDTLPMTTGASHSDHVTSMSHPTTLPASASASATTTSPLLPPPLLTSLPSKSTVTLERTALTETKSSLVELNRSSSTQLLKIFTPQLPRPLPSAATGGDSRCGPVEMVVTGGGLQRQTPATFTRRDSFQLRAYVLHECHRHLLSDVMWRIFRLSEENDDDMVEIWMPTVFVTDSEVHILRYTIDYGTYKIQAKVVHNGREFFGDAYVTITSSPLTVKIVGDDVIQTDTETAVTIKAEPGVDVDEPRELSQASMTFEWLCMNSGEKSPYSDPLHEDNALGVGCYGDGRRMNVSSSSRSLEFRFDPDLLYYTDLPAIFTVQVALTKPRRARALASQHVVVIYPENPLRIRCLFNCGAYMNTWMEMVLSASCSAPVCRDGALLSHKWDFLPLCPQNSVKQIDWTRDTETNSDQPNLHLKANVFNATMGSEPYQFTLTVTTDDSRQFETRYQFLTRRQDAVVVGANLTQEGAKLQESTQDGTDDRLKAGRFFCLVVLTQLLFLLLLHTDQ